MGAILNAKSKLAKMTKENGKAQQIEKSLSSIMRPLKR